MLRETLNAQRRRPSRLATVRPRLLIVLVAALLFVWGCAQEASDVEETTPPVATKHHFLTLSDIHFDPFYDPTLLDELIAKDASEWESIFETSQVHTLMDTSEERHDQDTNYPLLKSTLAAAAAEIRNLADKKVDYVLITGDFLSHGFVYDYPGDDFDAYSSFVLKTMTFLRDQLASAFPDTPIFPALGNNDAYCGDYAVSPGSGFLPATAALWQDLVGQPLKDFSANGSYAIDHPVVANLELLMWNDIPFSKNYPRSDFPNEPQRCNAATGDLQSAEADWLDKELAQAKGRVALAFHIPPGMDQYSTSKNEGEHSDFRATVCGAPLTCDSTDYVGIGYSCDEAAAFVAAVSPHIAKVDYIMAAHTHMDDFRVFQVPDRSGGKVPVLVHFNPSVSIHNDNNPGFQVFEYDPKDGALDDYTTYYLSNVESAGSQGPDDPPAAWEELYTFSEEYIQGGGLPAGKYDVTAVSGLIEKLQAEASFAQGTYWQFHGLNAPLSGADAIDDSDWDVYQCTLGSLTKAEFAACYCAASGG